MNKKSNSWKSNKADILKAILVLVLAVISLNAKAQNNVQISGTVRDEEDVLIGASVAEKGTTNGTMTDIEGRFTLSVKENAVIEITYIGFETQTITVGTRREFNIEMKSNANILEEVVAIGYGVQKKKLNTGATLQIKGDELTKKSTTSALQALQGQTPGVQISSTSGQPGDGFRVTVRGIGTTGNSAPLYIVDGVQTGDISYLNNSDIESVDVLKDAASAAIYGSQSANGVVLITTKTGSKGRMSLSFDAYYGWQSAGRKAKLLNAREYATIMNEANVNSGNAPYFSQQQIDQMGNGTNWLNEMLEDNVPTESYTLSLQGGSEASIYSMSVGYTSQGGIVGGSDLSNYKRYSFRLNTEHKLYNNIVKVGQHATFTYSKKQGVETGNQYNNSLRGAFSTSPFLPMYDDDGNFVNTAKPSAMVNGEEWKTWYDGESNPYANMVYNNQNRNNTQKLIGDIYLEAEPVKRLKYRFTVGLEYTSNESRSYTPVYELSKYNFNNIDKVYQSMNKGRAWNIDNVLSYDFDINADHQFSTMIGTSARQYAGSYLNARNADLTIGDLNHAWIDNGTSTDLIFRGSEGGPDPREQLLSFFGRFNYNYKEKYLLNATFRADGSSKFHPDNRWGYFPSVSLGWIISNESWMQNTQSWMDYAKIRASWGQVGNQSIPSYRYMGLITTNNTDYIFGNGSGADKNTPGAYPSSLPNKDLKWETSEQINLGFDARFLSGKLNANFDWYYKKTKDWLVEIPVLATSGVNSRYVNGGDVVNKGIEINLSYSDIIGKDFSYTVSGNIAYNKNKVGSIPTDDQIIHGLSNQLYNNSTEFYRAQNGFPIGYFWGWKTDGIFQNQAEIDNYVDKNGNKIQPTAKPGDVRYKDLNGDGKINDKDKTKVGDPNPDMTFGLTLTLNYKDFDFTISSNGTLGNQIVQSYRNHTDQYANYTTRILDRWHGEGTSNKIPRVTNTNINWQFSDLYVQDGDYWRINNITLGYNFNKLINKKFISQLRVYASVQNPFTFTKYDGMDPEIGYGLGTYTSGVDVGFYPNPRTFLLGANVKF